MPKREGSLESDAMPTSLHSHGHGIEKRGVEFAIICSATFAQSSYLF